MARTGFGLAAAGRSRSAIRAIVAAGSMIDDVARLRQLKRPA